MDRLMILTIGENIKYRFRNGIRSGIIEQVTSKGVWILGFGMQTRFVKNERIINFKGD